MTNQETIDAVLEIIDADPNASVREISRIMRTNAEAQHQLVGMGLEAEAGQTKAPSPTSIYRILKVCIPQKIVSNRPFQIANLHPYKMRLVQELTANNRATRAEHAVNMLNIINARPEFLSLLLFTDEAHFEQHGQVNHQNFRYWSTDRPENFFRAVPLHSPRLTVWAGISKSGIIGPFFTRQTINGARYLEMLQIEVILSTLLIRIARNTHSAKWYGVPRSARKWRGTRNSVQSCLLGSSRFARVANIQ